MDKDGARAYVDAARWRPTKPDGRYADCPHQYHRRSEASDLDGYHELVRLIRREGIYRLWRGYMFRYLTLDDGYSYWAGRGAVVNRVRTDTL